MTSQDTLEGLEVVLTGRLFSMRRDEARERLAAVGARSADWPTETTDLFVVGRAALPLDADGAPTRSLARARELTEAGAKLQICTEEELLSRLGLEDHSLDLKRHYTTAQLARMLDVPLTRVRAWVRRGLIRPTRTSNRLSFFDFREVASARTLSQLSREGASPAQIARGLRELEAWLPEGEVSLSQLALIEGVQALGVRTEQGHLAETSGQLCFRFDELEAHAPPVHALAPEDWGPEGWFAAGVSAEDAGRLEDAVEAYRESLALGGPRAETFFNLGNVYYALEELQEAARRFLQAAELEPDYAEAWNNLGIVLTDLDRPDEAIEAYRRALVLEADYADAHFNLAETLANAGRTEEARRHWRAYLAHDPSSPWARDVRQRLAREGTDEPER